MAQKRCGKKSAVYQTARNHLDFYFRKIIDSPESEFTLMQLREKLASELGFRFQKKSLKRYLEESEDKFGEAPLTEVYRLNPRYYEKAGDLVCAPYARIGRPKKYCTSEEYQKYRSKLRIRRKNYNRVRRFPERYLRAIFQDRSEADSEYISSRIAEMAEGLSLQNGTVDIVVGKYNQRLADGKIKGPRIEPDPERPGTYRLVD